MSVPDPSTAPYKVSVPGEANLVWSVRRRIALPKLTYKEVEPVPPFSTMHVISTENRAGSTQAGSGADMSAR